VVMERATVVNLRVDAFDVYIGRGSPWGNPFRVGAGFSRARVLEEYEKHLWSNPELFRRLPELAGRRLGCYCAPLPCHGDLLVKLVNETCARCGCIRGEHGGGGGICWNHHLSCGRFIEQEIA
jgi:Domain of unknown function (DUF4326)